MFNWNSFVLSPRPWWIHAGDALHLLRAIPDGVIDSIVTDPPYGIALKLGTRSQRNSIAGDGKLQAKKLWERWIPEAYRVAKADSTHLVFGTWKSPWMHDLLSQHFAVKGCIAWDKRVIGLGHYLRPRWEMIYFCTKGRPPRRGVAPCDLWEQARIHRTQHPCEKPVPLLRRAVCLVSDPGEIVLDPFCGIGAAITAAVLEGRRGLGSEINRRYARMSDHRCAAANQKAIQRSES